MARQNPRRRQIVISELGLQIVMFAMTIVVRHGETKSKAPKNQDFRTLAEHHQLKGLPGEIRPLGGQKGPET